MATLKQLIDERVLILDGAMGTMLQKEGLPIGDNPEIFGMKNPDKLLKIHKKYLEAGSNVFAMNSSACQIWKNSMRFSSMMVCYGHYRK